MKEPYRTLWTYLVVENNWPSGKWRYDVKWTGNAFYIGTDADHVTVLEGTAGFHHSYDEHGEHKKGNQRDLETISLIVDHVDANPRSYLEPKVAAALKFIEKAIT